MSIDQGKVVPFDTGATPRTTLSKALGNAAGSHLTLFVAANEVDGAVTFTVAGWTSTTLVNEAGMVAGQVFHLEDAPADVTVTVVASRTCDFACLVAEDAGIATASSIDLNVAGAAGLSTSPATGAATTAQADEVIYGLVANQTDAMQVSWGVTPVATVDPTVHRFGQGGMEGGLGTTGANSYAVPLPAGSTAGKVALVFLVVREGEADNTPWYPAASDPLAAVVTSKPASMSYWGRAKHDRVYAGVLSAADIAAGTLPFTFDNLYYVGHSIFVMNDVDPDDPIVVAGGKVIQKTNVQGTTGAWQFPAPSVLPQIDRTFLAVHWASHPSGQFSSIAGTLTEKGRYNGGGGVLDHASGCTIWADGSTPTPAYVAIDTEKTTGIAAVVALRPVIQSGGSDFDRIGDIVTANARTVNRVRLGVYRMLQAEVGERSLAVTLVAPRGWVAKLVSFKAAAPPPSTAEPVLFPALQVTVSTALGRRVLNGTGKSADGAVAWGINPSSAVDAGPWNGYLTCFFKIMEAERQANRNVYRAGATVSVKIAPGEQDAGELVWEGELQTPVPNENHTCSLKARGWGNLLRRKVDWLAQHRYGQDWTKTGGAPYVEAFDSDDSIKVDVNPGSILFSAERGTEVATGDRGRAALWLDDHRIRYFRASLRQKKVVPGASSGGAKWAAQLWKYNGPADFGSKVLRKDWADELATVAADELTVDMTADPKPLITLELVRLGVGLDALEASFAARFVHPRVNGELTTADSWYASDVMEYVADFFGFPKALVEATTRNILPLWWRQEVVSLCDYMTQLHAGKRWALWSRSRGLEFGDWSGSTLWSVRAYSSDAWASPAIEPADDYELFSHVDVTWHRVGKPKALHIIRPVTPNPMAGTGNPVEERVFDEVEILEPQPDNTLAVAVAEAWASELAAPQLQGEIVTGYLVNTATGATHSARLAKGGDRVRIDDYPDGPLTLRLYEADHPEGERSRLSVGRIPKRADRLLAWMQRRQALMGKEPSEGS